jgi:hypothetical protein
MPRAPAVRARTPAIRRTVPPHGARHGSPLPALRASPSTGPAGPGQGDRANAPGSRRCGNTAPPPKSKIVSMRPRKSTSMALLSPIANPRRRATNRQNEVNKRYPCSRSSSSNGATALFSAARKKPFRPRKIRSIRALSHGILTNHRGLAGKRFAVISAGCSGRIAIRSLFVKG